MEEVPSILIVKIRAPKRCKTENHHLTKQNYDKGV